MHKYITRILLITSILFVILQPSNAQCDVKNSAFKDGEVLKYDAFYNWGFIWINAGLVEFKANSTEYKNEDAWHLVATGRTRPNWDSFKFVRDTFETYASKEGIRPLYFNRVTNEGSTVSHHIYKFNYDQNLIRSKISRGENASYTDSMIYLKQCTSDLISMVYKARNINYTQYNVGEKIPIVLLIDGDIYDLYIRYKGKEEIETRDGRKFKCLKFSPLLVPGTIFKEGEGMTVWVTDDRNRIPIQVEAKILIGSVKAIFTDAINTRYPIAAEVYDD